MLLKATIPINSNRREEEHYEGVTDQRERERARTNERSGRECALCHLPSLILLEVARVTARTGPSCIPCEHVAVATANESAGASWSRGPGQEGRGGEGAVE